MSLLVDLVPETVEVGGAEYPINTDFRASILFELMMQDKQVPKEELWKGALDLYFAAEIPEEHQVEAVRKGMWFYCCGREQMTAAGGKGGQEKRIYSFEHDDDYIYSAFLEQYGIDLQDIEDLHWWKFRALFRSLQEDCKISKIMSYRAMDLSKMTDSERKHYARMKLIYALPDDRDDEEKEQDFANALGF